MPPKQRQDHLPTAQGQLSFDQTFQRQRRLLTPSDYKRVFAKNGRVSDRYWTLLYRDSQLPMMRLGMAVAKKNIRRAVDRNRIKRLVRDTFRLHLHRGTVDVVVLPRASCTGASNEELRQSLNSLWSRIASKCAK